ncbi:DNA-3-methyladenine glycosylase 2 family protein [Shewanella psychrotolerans]|uniref:DNA-3-methyladenine glycosylase 2 family protein n=1 Tax=Shewanella psychrotolerans TaxID=2864206 RepID=UPI001C65AD1D|nr:AlkA N-terminal domain-containing protein [Shewanella psychrotolerans]QYK00233.1 helix-turn-helix domain-containing protein [Shewanella psychrotolerans]
MNCDNRSTTESFRRARLSRDPRFDGLFFVGVLSTGIYCRPICPAVAAKEANVRYFDSALAAANEGLRPCLRCRPDSAPQSNPWIGTQTTMNRAVTLINNGILSGPEAISIAALADKLGISSRYLRALFHQHIGASPKQYALYQQLMFAKQLLHQTAMPITDVAFAAGFNSVRRFNEVFLQQLQLTPSAIRKSHHSSETLPADSTSLNLRLFYRPPFNWRHQCEFYRRRAVNGMEWIGEDHYGRSFQLNGVTGYFEATHCEDSCSFNVKIVMSSASALTHLHAVVTNIRRMLDLDADLNEVESRLADLNDYLPEIDGGIRIPGVWSLFEAACRAVLGQQVSVAQSVTLLQALVEHYGEIVMIEARQVRLFPTAESIALASLDCLNMPGARKNALRALALFISHHPHASVDDWLSIKGIGPWTVDYVRLRGLSLPNIFLASDLVVKNQLLANLSAAVNAKYPDESATKNEKQQYYLAQCEHIYTQISPWGSYLTFQLWSQQ